MSELSVCRLPARTGLGAYENLEMVVDEGAAYDSREELAAASEE